MHEMQPRVIALPSGGYQKGSGTWGIRKRLTNHIVLFYFLCMIKNVAIIVKIKKTVSYTAYSCILCVCVCVNRNCKQRK